MSGFTVFTTDSGDQFRCTEEQAATLKELQGVVAGGIGTVHSYVSTSDRVKPEIADIQFITHFSTARLYERKISALRDLTYSDVSEFAEKHDKILALSESERENLFNTRRNSEIASMEKTLEGDRSDNRRQAHDRVFCQIAKGIKVHFHTFKEDYIDADGKKKKRTVPEMVAGLPVAKSINLTVLVLNKTVKQEGEYVVRNSGAPVLMSTAISRGLNIRSVGLKTLSLKEDNFDSLVVSRKTFLAEEFKQIPSDLFLPIAA